MRGGSILELLIILLLSGLLSNLAFKKIFFNKTPKLEYFVKANRTNSLLKAEKVTLQVRNKKIISTTGEICRLNTRARINTPRRRIEFYVSGAASPGSIIVEQCRVVVSLRGRVRSVC